MGSRVSTRLGGTPRYIVIVVDCQSTQKSCIMSDEEYYEEEEVEEEEEYEEEEEEQTYEKKSVKSELSQDPGDGSFLKARQGAKKGELDEQLREYINEWR